MFGGNRFYFFDATLDIWGSFLSSCALVTWAMGNRAVCREYSKFNESFERQLENGGPKVGCIVWGSETIYWNLGISDRLLRHPASGISGQRSQCCCYSESGVNEPISKTRNPWTSTSLFRIFLVFKSLSFQCNSVLKNFENQLIDFFDAASFVTNSAAFLLDSTFICGFYIHVTALFGIYSFKSSFQGIQMVLFFLWYLQSILMLVLSLKRPTTLQTLVRSSLACFSDREGLDSRFSTSFLFRKNSRFLTFEPSREFNST